MLIQGKTALFSLDNGENSWKTIMNAQQAC